MYTAVYNENSPIYEVGEYGDGKKYRIPLPVPPPRSGMRNYGKPKNEQLFERETMPRFKSMKPAQLEEFVKTMWHKRRNGEWWLIGGKEVYIPGTAWTYLNFWTVRKGGRPQFRMNDIEWFYFMGEVKRDKTCLGVFELKPRRIGETEKISFLLWEHATRIRKSHCGIMSKTDKDAKKTYLVLIKAHSKMPFFFKPINRGTSAPQDGIIFDYPEVRQTITAVKSNKQEKLYEHPALESSIDYMATTFGAYDGEVLHMVYWDEVGKVPTSKLDVEGQIGVLAECCTENVGTKIVGKMILASTVEDMDEGKQSRSYVDNVKLAQAIWDGSNPEEKNPVTGMTTTGLWRYFRSYEAAADVDRFGFPLIEPVREARRQRIAMYEKQERFAQLMRYKRKYPATVEEALMPSVADCDLHPELIDRRIAQINQNLYWNGSSFDDRGREVTRKSATGNLEWVDGKFGGTVTWMPDLPGAQTTGRWEIGQHPPVANNKIWDGEKYMPGNTRMYKCGIDPIGTMTGSRFRSNGGIAVFRPFDLTAERANPLISFDEFGNIMNPWEMSTDKFVCAYSYRHDNPFHFFDDCLRTLVYYGCLGHLEESVQYIENTFRDNGFERYLQRKPTELGGSVKRMQYGTKATASIIDTYVSKLKQHSFERWYLYDLLVLLKDMRYFNIQNRGKRDLTVAAGYALLADMDGRLKYEEEEYNEEESWHPLAGNDTGGFADPMTKYIGR